MKLKSNNITIACDCDGVLSDFTGYCLEKIGLLGEPTPKIENIIKYKIEDFLSFEQIQYMYSVLKQKNFWANLPIIPGAQEAISEIKYFGFNVLYVTSAWAYCPDWHWLRADWLRRYFDVDPNDIIICRKKGRIFADIMIDDYDKNIEDFIKTQPEKLAILYEQPWNLKSTVVKIPKVCRMNWNEIVSILPDLINTLNSK